nr:glycoside hydrolase family 3 C-terminal domain-containing protein [Candidatus Sigynarchaeota archaeon]
MSLNWFSLVDLPESEIEPKICEILGQMTLAEKVKQMSADWPLISKWGLGMAKRYNFIPIPGGRNARLGIPPIAFTDGPRGIVMGASTCFPVSMARGATWDIALEEQVGNVIGIEARAQDANFFAGVCINLLRHPAWGRAQETYGEDPVLLGEMGSALVRGVQMHVMACAKHYACNSIENARFKINVKVDERTLREVYLPHFKRCVDAGVASIMSAYNKVNGYHCGHNVHLLRDILKRDWNFKGFVISDFILGVRDGKAAVLGGMDLEYPFKLHMKPAKLLRLLKKGDITESMIDDSVIRILRQQLRFTLKRDPALYTSDKVACKEHTQLALTVARKSIVLLKNEDNTLPLDKTRVRKVAVFGKLAITANIGDHGSSRVHPSHVVTPLQGIKSLVGDHAAIEYSAGKKLSQATRLAKDADAVIVVVGCTNADEGEYLSPFSGGDRKSLELKKADQGLITAVASSNKRCIVVLIGGSAFITEKWRARVPAIVMAWYPGMEGGKAIAELLFGDVNPSGKLPVAFPASTSQLPRFDNKTKEITYEYFHGYKLMDKRYDKPAFPFGFGLSYTKFSYSNLRVERENIDVKGNLSFHVDVQNTGDRAGEEVVQAYVGYKDSKVDRPVKELKAFRKVGIEPGAKETVSLSIPAKDLAFYDVQSNMWVTESIEYVLFVGPSSRKQDLLVASFRV